MSKVPDSFGQSYAKISGDSDGPDRNLVLPYHPGALYAQPAAPPATIAFVDTSIEGWQDLVAGIGQGAEVILIPQTADALGFMSDALATRSNVGSVHILSHGGDGFIAIGDQIIDTAALTSSASALSGWSAALTGSADILIYGCSVGADTNGQRFMDTLARLTGADVAASSDLTGSAANGGDWALEVRSGQIETNALDLSSSSFNGTLGATFSTTFTTIFSAAYAGDSNQFTAPQTMLFDVDGDSDLDLLMLPQYGTKSIYKNDGDGNFTAFSTFGSGNVSQAKAADLNGDGIDDLMVRPADGKLQIFMNNGTGTFSLSTSLGSNSANLNDAFTYGDLDGDDDVDIIVGIEGTSSVYLNNGTGTFTASGTITNNTLEANRGVQGMALADLDRDGDLDLAIDVDTSIVGLASTTLFINNGSGGFSSSGVRIGSAYSGGVFAADFNNDGFDDLYQLSDDLSISRIYFNNGTFNLTRSGDNPIPFYPSQPFDVDNDGDVDFASGSNVYVNNGSGTFTPTALSFPHRASVANEGDKYISSTGDIDGDGDADAIVVANFYQYGYGGPVQYTSEYTLAWYVNQLASASAPEILIQGNLTEIADGDTTPSSTDHTAFGTTNVTGGTIVRTFTVANTGDAPLTISSVSITGANSGDFSVTSALGSSVAANGSTTFQVTFNPSASGTRTATITVNNNDSSEAVYDFSISGVGNAEPAVNANTGLALDEGATGTVTAARLDFNDADQADGAITYTVTTAATNGTLFRDGVALALNSTFTQADINANLITYSHNGGETTSASFGFSVSDGQGATVSGQTFSFTVTPVNDDPTIANAIANQSATEDAPFAFQFASNVFADVDVGDTFTYTAQLAGGGALPSWLSFDPVTRTFSGTPLNGDVSTVSVDVISSDGNGGTVTDTFDIVVANTNDDPTIANAIANQSATEDSAFNFQFASNVFADVDVGDTFTYTAQLAGGGALPSWLSFDPLTRTFSGTPLNGDVGTLSVDVIADDGNGGTVTDTFDIIIAATNDAPSLAGDFAATVAEGGAVTLLAADLDYFDIDDAPEDVTFTVSSLVNGVVQVNGVTQTTFTGADLAAGDVTFVHDGSETASASFDVTVEDGDEDASAPVGQTFNFDVTPVNEAPTAVLGTLAVDEYAANDTVVGTLSAIDVDSTTFTYVLVDDAGGRFKLVGDQVQVADGLSLDHEQAATHTIRVEVTDDLGETFEQDLTVTIGDVTPESVTGDGRDNRFVGGIDGDSFKGAGGDDTLEGGGGIDTIYGEDGSDLILGGDGDDALYGEDMFAKGAGGADTLDGGSGNDELTGGTLADLLRGGTGDDLYVDPTGDIILEFAGEGVDTVRSSSTFLLAGVQHVENLTLTGTADINATGNFADNVLTGNDGANRLRGSTGTDTLIGGLGNDTYADPTGDVIVEAAGGGVDTVESEATFTLGGISHVENLTLTGTADIDGRGNNADNVITGNDGANRLNGSLGADTLIGGLGNDTYVNPTGDTIIELPGGGTDTLESNVTFNLTGIGRVERLVLTGNGHIDGTGNGHGNEIVGNAGNNRLSGLGGVDTLIGGLGNDTYVDPLDDVIVELAGQGTDTVENFRSFNLAGLTSVENLVLTGVLNSVGEGNELNNHITGNSGNNLLRGGDGNDTLAGGAGIDTMNGGAGDDTYVDPAGEVIVEGVSGGSDTIVSSITATLSGRQQVENLTLTGSADIDAAGNSYDNVITGNDGANRLEGRAGADTLIGGAGNDIYVDPAGDTIIERAGGGVDTVLSSSNFILAGVQHVENVTLTGTGDTVVIGNYADNVLIGNSGANRLRGSQGSDTIEGGAGADTFVFGAVDESNGVVRDLIVNANLNLDKFDFDTGIVNLVPVSIAAAVTTGALNEASFEADLATAIGAGQLGIGQAVLFTASSGDLAVAGQSFMVVDTNGIAGYQAGADYVVQLSNHTGTLSLDDFI